MEYVLERKCRKATGAEQPLPSAVMDRLITYSWPLNVRAMEKGLEFYVTFGRLPEGVNRANRPQAWRERIDEEMQRHGGNKAAAAKTLGVSRQTLHEELRLPQRLRTE